MGQFAKDMAAFEKLVEKRATMVPRIAGIAMYREMQTDLYSRGGFWGTGNVPVDTGTLRESLESYTDAVFEGMGAESYKQSLMRLKLGQTHRTARGPNLYPDGSGKTAEDYAEDQEFFGPPQGRRFTTEQTDLWLAYVHDAAEEVRRVA